MTLPILIVYAAVAVLVGLAFRSTALPSLDAWRNRARRRRIAERMDRGEATDIEVAWLRRTAPTAAAKRISLLRALACGACWPVLVAGLAVLLPVAASLLVLYLAGVLTLSVADAPEAW
jgi:hypothetical protein